MADAPVARNDLPPEARSVPSAPASPEPTVAENPGEPRRTLALFAAIAVAWLYFIPYFPGLTSPPEVSRAYQIRALIEDHTLAIDPVVKRLGRVNDTAKYQGRLYPNKAPGTTFLGAPVYAVQHFLWGLAERPVSLFAQVYAHRLFCAILPTLAFLFLFRRFLRRALPDPEGEAVAAFLVATLALGTMMFSYGILFVNHAVSAATAFGTVMAVRAARSTDNPRRRFWLLAGAGLLASLSAALDYALFPVAILLLVYLVATLGWSARDALATAIGGAPPAILTAIYHTLCFGGPFRLGVEFHTNQRHAAWEHQGVFGLVGPTWTSVSGVLYSRRGLFTWSPFFALALLSTFVALRDRHYRKEAILSFAITWSIVLYGVSLVMWHGGWTVGPRYLTPMCPFVFFSLALAWRQLPPLARRAILPVAAGLALASVIMTGGTTVLFPHALPAFKNAFFDMTWPLWRDGITPLSLGWFLASLRGRADQLPVLLDGAVLAAGMVAFGSGIFLRQTRSRAVALGAGLATVLTAALVLGLWSIPHSDAKTMRDRTTWIRQTLWEPPLPGHDLAPGSDGDPSAHGSDADP